MNENLEKKVISRLPTAASRITTPSSPGSTKRKVQQKLQREGKPQLPSPRMSASNKGSPSPLLKHYSGSRIPGTKAGIPTPSSSNQTPKSDHKDSSLPAPRKVEQKSYTPDPHSKSSNRIAQSNYRSNISRLSNKNSDATSEYSSDSGSCRSTPVYGSQSPLESAKKAISPPMVTSSSIPHVRPSTGVPTKCRTPSSLDRKRSSDTLPIRREHTFDSSKERKTSSPIMVSRHKGSCENISKSPKSLSGSTNTLEKSSIPMSRNKQSSESLPASLEENSLSMKQHYESSSSIASSSRRSSIESTASDSSDISKLPKMERYSKLPTSSDQKKGTSRVPGIPSVSKRPSAESPSLKTKVKQPTTVNKSTSRIKQPTASNKKVGNSDSQIGIPHSSTVDSSEKSDISHSPSTKHSNLPSRTIPTNSAIRPPGSLVGSDKKKKKIESPLTHRNKLTYSNAKPEIARPKDATRITSESSKLSQPGTGNSSRSPATARNTKYGRPQGTPNTSSKLQAPLRFTPTPLGSANVNNNNLSDSQEIDFKREDVVEHVEGNEVMKINEKNNTDQERKNQLDRTIEEVDVNVTTDDKKLTKQFDNLHIYQDDHDSRDIESMNSSRSSEMDDGYSSLHKLDNLSPTLGEELDKSNSDVIQNITRTDMNENVIEERNSISAFPNDDIDDDDDDDIDDENILKNQRNEIDLSGPLQNIAEDRYGYADPEDSIQRISTDMSDYKVPMDCKSSLDDDTLDRTCVDEFSISSAHTFYQSNQQREDSIQIAADPFTEAFEDQSTVEKATSASPFKRIHPKVIVPPPPINSICKNGELAPVPSEYSRTPSSDGDEIQLSKYYSGDLRRRAREQAKKVWTKTSRPHDFEDDMDCTDDGKGRERLESDIFYSSKDIEKAGIDLPPKYATRTSVRSFETPLVINSDTNFRFDSISSDPEKKKKSKIKKFFKKLSTNNKKDGKPEFDARLFPENCRFSDDAYPRLPYRRSSEGVDSCHSIQDMHEISPPSASTPPISKRRMFTFNLSFMKKGRRHRSNTGSHSAFPDEVCDNHPQLSNTVRALCSPDLGRRADYIAVRHDHRGSDPSLYHFNRPLSPTKKKYRAPDPPNAQAYSSHHDSGRRNMSSSSGFSTDDVADYANYPFSKVNIKAPMKPQRLTKGSCNSDRCSNHSGGCSHDSRVNYIDGISSSTEHIKDKRRSGSQSSDSSIMSTESSSYMCPKPVPYDSVSTRSTGSLRRTPLRHSVDNFNKLLEVHKQTIDKIAFEISTLRCECETLYELEWDDFERAEDMIQLGLNSHMVVPVSCTSGKLSDKRRFFAWLRLSQQHTIQTEYPVFDFSKSTLHRNCIHACHIMQQNYSAPFQDGIPKAIQIDCVYISTQCPKMTLSKYISLTLEKHSRYPEIYEREAAMILLQVVKGIQNLHANDAKVSSIESDNVFILNNGEPSVVLSPRREPNRCPAVAVSVLPGLGDCFRKTETDAVTSICHQLAFLLFELLHSPYQDELSDAVDMSMLLATLPDLTIKSIYSRYLQYVINVLLATSSHTTKSLDDLQIILEIILFGPSDLSEHSEEETIVLINKWHNRRCVDMVTHILKEAPLIMLCASGPSAQDIDKIKNVDQEILLECEFLSYVSAADIYRVSKMLNR